MLLLCGLPSLATAKAYSAALQTRADTTDDAGERGTLNDADADAGGGSEEGDADDDDRDAVSASSTMASLLAARVAVRVRRWSWC